MIKMMYRPRKKLQNVKRKKPRRKIKKKYSSNAFSAITVDDGSKWHTKIKVVLEATKASGNNDC
jgi:hypothetical protein